MSLETECHILFYDFCSLGFHYSPLTDSKLAEVNECIHEVIFKPINSFLKQSELQIKALV